MLLVHMGSNLFITIVMAIYSLFFRKYPFPELTALELRLITCSHKIIGDSLC